MDRNTITAIVLSFLFLTLWAVFMQKPKPLQAPAARPDISQPQEMVAPANAPLAPQAAAVPEKEITVDTPNYRAVFTTRGAALRHWYIKEKNGSLTDLILTTDAQSLTTFPGSVFSVAQPKPNTLVFTHASPLGWRAVKTYALSDDYLHSLTIDMQTTRPGVTLPRVEIDWGPGLGTTESELKENTGLTRAIMFKDIPPRDLKKLKPGDYPFKDQQWAAVENRYFLAALIPGTSSAFSAVSVYQPEKRQPVGLALIGSAPADAARRTYALQFYVGPKNYTYLKSLNLNLEKSVDFGFFGPFGKLILQMLHFFYRLTHNYGWAIILLAVLLQIILLPLTLKSLKSSADMKKLQPHMKVLQEQYKNDPKRLQMEMMNLYKAHKFNPLGGCLPLLLQTPVFIALFNTLRGAYELRGASWIFWIKDLSQPDTIARIGAIPIHVLPLIWGVGMFLQQKMMSVATDPSQKSLTYLMPVVITFAFWGLPSGLVLYWITQSAITMAEQLAMNRRMQQA